MRDLPPLASGNREFSLGPDAVRLCRRRRAGSVGRPRTCVNCVAAPARLARSHQANLAPDQRRARAAPV